MIGWGWRGVKCCCLQIWYVYQVSCGNFYLKKLFCDYVIWGNREQMIMLCREIAKLKLLPHFIEIFDISIIRKNKNRVYLASKLISIQAAKISRPDGPGPVESSTGPTLLSLHRPHGACRFSGRHLLRILGNVILQLLFPTINASLLFLKYCVQKKRLQTAHTRYRKYSGPI